MFRSTFLVFLILIILIMSFINGKELRNRKRELLLKTTRKPTSIKICGSNLVRMLDMICQRARELIMNKQDSSSSSSSSSYGKRQMIIDDDPFTRTLSIKDYAQFNNTLIGDCCLQACTLKTLLKYC